MNEMITEVWRSYNKLFLYEDNSSLKNKADKRKRKQHKEIGNVIVAFVEIYEERTAQVQHIENKHGKMANDGNSRANEVFDN